VKLSEVIAEAQKLLEKHGDLEVFDHEHHPFDGFWCEVAKDLPPNWDMPDGYRFIKMKYFY
jgi:hypothetical protein